MHIGDVVQEFRGITNDKNSIKEVGPLIQQDAYLTEKEAIVKHEEDHLI